MLIIIIGASAGVTLLCLITMLVFIIRRRKGVAEKAFTPAPKKPAFSRVATATAPPAQEPAAVPLGLPIRPAELPAPQPAQPPTVLVGGVDVDIDLVLAKLEDLEALLDAGALTQEEFDAQKWTLLSA